MNPKDKILQIIRIKGPVVPSNVSGEINSNILMASAYLSELTAEKKVKISTLKIGGGSPLYYLSGQESRLQDFSKYLNEKNRKAYDYLKEKKILRDSELSPLLRVALREIKDFAKPLEVAFNNKQDLFWKWYLLDNEEAGKLIKQRLGIIPKQEPQSQPEPQKEEPPKAELQKIKQDVLKKEPEKEVLPEPIKTEEPKIQKIHQEQPQTEEKQETLPKEEPTKVWNNTQSEFIDKIKSFFNSKRIKVIETNIIRKNSEIEFTLEIDSNIGRIIYFCKAKNKKKINDGDLSSAFIQGQMKKLPPLLLITGDITKKAQILLESELKGLMVVHIN